MLEVKKSKRGKKMLKIFANKMKTNKVNFFILRNNFLYWVNIIGAGFLSKVFQFVLNLFGRGQTEIEKKASLFCDPNFQEIITKMDVNKLFEDLLIDSANEDTKEIFLKIRNQSIENVIRVYQKAKINPMIQFLISNRPKIPHSLKIKLFDVLNGYHFHEFKDEISKLQTMPLVTEKIKSSLHVLAGLKENYIRKLSESIGGISNDFTNGGKGSNEFEKSYFFTIEKTKNFFDSLETLIKSMSLNLMSDLTKDLQYIFANEINKEILKILAESPLNKEIGYLDSNSFIDVNVLFNYVFLAKIDDFDYSN
jgi:hypothetical protein